VPAPAGPGPEAYRALVRRAAESFDAVEVRGWETERHVPRSALAALAGAGVFAARWEQGAYRGAERLTVLVEEVFRRDSGLALAAIGHSEIFIGALTRHGRGEAHAALLRDALAGRAVGCFAATEPQGGANLAGLECAAERVPGGWRLTGTKRYVSNLGSATHAVVLARAGDAEGVADLSLFVVPLDTPGAVIDGYFDTSGVRACDVGQLSLDVRLPEDALLGSAGLGLLYASHLLQFERLAICVLLLAAAERALTLGAAYARERKVLGVRVMDKQIIRHRLALARAELWNLQSRLSELTSFVAREAAMPAHPISALKLTAGQRAAEIIDMCMQIFGARGNTGAYPLEKLWRDCRVARIGGGTDEVLADMVASYLDRADPEAEEFLAAAAAADTPIARIARPAAQAAPHAAADES
jgi:alkylation response protein AidB-like acyl-CoA dehydrogenase